MTLMRCRPVACLMAGWLVACLGPGAQAHPVSAEQYNSMGSCAAFGNSVGEGVWSWCYNNERDNMNGCKASFRSWVRELEQACNGTRREAGCSPSAYDAVQWHIHGTKAGQTIGVQRAVRSCEKGTQGQGAGEAAPGLDRETRRRIQSALAAQGYDPGQPDGVFGPSTRGAIQAWQQATGYAATGVLTSGQVERLLTSEGASGSAAPGDLYGAIAFSQLGGGGYAFGIAWNAQGREAARRSAIEECGRQGGGSGCHEAGWFRNGCGAIAIGDQNGYGTGGGETNAKAESAALSKCRSANRNCRVEVSRCVDGDYRRPERVSLKPFGPNWSIVENQPCQVWNYGEAETYRPLTWSGACVDGKASGEGRLIFIYEGRGSYRGNMVGGKAHGHGIANWADGSRYEGEFRDGKRTGRGTYTWANGERYEGEWRDGKRTGRGTYTWADGSRYEGEFRDGKFHGRGTYTWADGDSKTCEWRDGESVDGTCESH